MKCTTRIEKGFDNQKLTASLVECGFRLSKWGQSGRSAPCVKIEGTPTEVMKLMTLVRAEGFAEGRGPEASKMKKYLLDDSQNTWAGGSYSQLLSWLSGEVDMGAYHTARDKLRGSGFDKKLREKIAMVAPRRKRAIAEHDGDWSLDRKWDTQPFMNTKKAVGAGRTIDIIVNLAASHGVAAKDFDAFGVNVWAVSDLIESAGIQTKIIARFDVERVGYSGGSYKGRNQIDTEIEIQLKDATQFVTPLRLAACFKTAFFRRAVFSLMVAASQLENGEVDYGLGSPRHGHYPIKFLPETGQLTMSVGTYRGEANAMEAEIIAAVESATK